MRIIALALLWCLPLAVSAQTLTHRYDFANPARRGLDSAGLSDLSVTTGSTFTEAPTISAMMPPGATGPGASAFVGASLGTKKSGFQLNTVDLLNSRADGGAVSLWVRPTIPSYGQYVIALLEWTGHGLVLFFQNHDTLRMMVVDGAGNPFVDYVGLASAKWYHIVINLDNPGRRVQLFVNGAQVGSTVTYTNDLTYATVRLGNYDVSDARLCLANQTVGYLYDLQFYYGALSSAQVAFLAANPGSRLGFGRVPTLVIANNSTIVASAIATQAPYNADNTGHEDATSSIQSALNAVRAVGGGVVFLPAGKYRINGSLRVGYRTALVGEWAHPDTGNIGQGTVLLAYGARGNAADAPLIDGSEADAGVIGLTIWYPDQSPNHIEPYPVTLAGGGGGWGGWGGLTIRNVTLCNSYDAIKLDPANACVCEHVYGTVLRRGITAPLTTEFTWMHDVVFANSYWANAAVSLSGKPLSADQLEVLNQYTGTHLIGLEFQRIDGIAVHHYRAPDAQTAIVLKKHPIYTNLVHGFGGLVADFQGTRLESSWAPWYYNMHYSNLDNVPEASDKRYFFAVEPIPSASNVPLFLDASLSPYCAAADGVGDDTTALQSALNDAEQHGGGIVFLRPGEYKVTRPLLVPSNVELRGPFGTGVSQEYIQTCALALYDGKDTTDPEGAPAGITLLSNSGIRGFSIIYPEQNYASMPPHRFPYTVRGHGSNVWLLDMMLVNSFNGIDLATYRCDEHLVRGLWGTVFHHGISVGKGSMRGRLERIAFSYGPWIEAASRCAPPITSDQTQALAEYVHSNAVYYTFGDCVGEKTWGMAGFYPNIQYHFASESGVGPRSLECWLSMHDSALRASVMCDSGDDISLLGYTGSGWGDFGNWLQVSNTFVGPLRIYAKMILQNSMVLPVAFSATQVQFYDEVSLTTGRAATGSQTDVGFDPSYAVDRDPRTRWQAPAGSYLEVDLGQVCLVNRFGIESAGFVLPHSLNTRTAVLYTSIDGLTFRSAGTLDVWGWAWGDMPVPPTYARYVRLVVTNPGADGTIRVATFNVFGPRPAELPTLRLDAPHGVTSGVFQMNLLGNGGRPTRVQTSTDLIQWSDVTNYVSMDWMTQFVDTRMWNSVQRYYRMVSP